MAFCTLSRVGACAARLSARAMAPSHTVRLSCSQRWATTYFSDTHEWVTVDGNIAHLGITKYAEDSLGEIVWVDQPAEGDEFDMNDEFGSIESVKAASELIAPVSMTILEVNQKLEDNPGLVNASPEKDGWIIKFEVTDPAQLEELFDESAYQTFCESL